MIIQGIELGAGARFCLLAGWQEGDKEIVSDGQGCGRLVRTAVHDRSYIVPVMRTCH